LLLKQEGFCVDFHHAQVEEKLVIGRAFFIAGWSILAANCAKQEPNLRSSALSAGKKSANYKINLR
jgi:hypothetical protein